MPTIRPASAGFLLPGQLLLWVEKRLIAQIDSEGSHRPLRALCQYLEITKKDKGGVTLAFDQITIKSFDL